MTVDELTCGITLCVPWPMLFADAIVSLIVLCSNRREKVETKLEKWSRAIKTGG